MMSVKDNFKNIRFDIPKEVELVAVSKTKPNEMILEAYEAGCRDFGENKVQELIGKQEDLPKNIKWHFIGHLQSNKVKYIAPFVYLIHGVDSLKLLKVINKEAAKNNKSIQCLLQLKIAKEESKYGLSKQEVFSIFQSEAFKKMEFVTVRGLMGMATYTDDQLLIQSEFNNLKEAFEESKTKFFDGNKSFNILSMGMSSDYKYAINEGANMVRIGSLIFGERQYC